MNQISPKTITITITDLKLEFPHVEREPRKAQHIMAWLARLEKFFKVREGSQDEEMYLVYAEHFLRSNIPTGAFNTDCFHFLVNKLKFFPTISELAEEVKSYWDEFKPPVENPDVDLLKQGLSQEDTHWIRGFEKNEMLGWHFPEDTFDVGEQKRNQRRISFLRLIKDMSPNAYKHIMKIPEKKEPYWETEQAVLVSLKSIETIPEGHFKKAAFSYLRKAISVKRPRFMPILEKEGA